MKKYLIPGLITWTVLGMSSWILWQKSSQRYAAITEQNIFQRLTSDWERMWYDFKLRLRQPEIAKGVMVATIDDASLVSYGRWPWNRNVYSAILNELFDVHGASVVGFDAVFSEPEFKGDYLDMVFESPIGGSGSEQLKEVARLDDKQIDSIVEYLPSIGDNIFGQAVASHPKTVLGYIWQPALECQFYDSEIHQSIEDVGEARQNGLLVHDDYVDSLSSIASQAIVVKDFPPFRYQKESVPLLWVCPTVNRSTIAAFAKHQGYFNSQSDADGNFRQHPIVFPVFFNKLTQDDVDFMPEAAKKWTEQAVLFPSLALKMVEVAVKSKKTEVELDRDSDGRVIIKAVLLHPEGRDVVRFPTLPNGALATNFYGNQTDPEWPNKPIAEFSLGRIQSDLSNEKLTERFELNRIQKLQDQVVLIGPTSLGVYDLRPTPVDPRGAGVFIHAANVGRMLEKVRDADAKISFHRADARIEIVLLWFFGLLLFYRLIKSSAINGALGVLVSFAVLLTLDYLLFSHFMLATDMMTLLISLGVIFASIFVYKYFTEERERAFVKSAFEKYVSPDVVGSIMDDPSQLNLGGEKKELSVLFSDIRGFTTISEKLEASELGSFLNEYLSPMTDIVLKHRGTIDKYMGDAIMAIYGAPIFYEKHAEHAVDTALEMLEELKGLNEAWVERGLPPIDIGVGINTGEMSVGNMGSQQIFSYTVMGDSVNLGSRLEGINKEYKTHLIVSESTRKQLGARYLCRELDRVKVKGKLEPVTIFEVLSNQEKEESFPWIEDFQKALKRYYGQDFCGASKLFESLLEKDPTSSIYVQRCGLWQENPPPVDWDGTWTMTTK